MARTAQTLPNRTCRYCKAKFKAVRQDQRFCKPDHRKAFWKYGGLPYDKMREQLWRVIKKELPAHVSAALAEQLPKAVAAELKRLRDEPHVVAVGR